MNERIEYKLLSLIYVQSSYKHLTCISLQFDLCSTFLQYSLFICCYHVSTINQFQINKYERYYGPEMECAQQL